MNRLLERHTNLRLSFGVIVMFGTICCNLLATNTASAATFKDRVTPNYFVYRKGSTVIANKSTVPSGTPYWVRDKFTPQITTEGVGCNNKKKNEVVGHDFNSYITFTNCDGLKIQEETSPSANDQWFEDVNMSYIVGDFDNHETINIGRGYIVASGRSAIGSPRGQTATAQKNASDSKGKDKYDCDTPNPNVSIDCSLLIFFSNGDKGDFYITLDDNGYKNSIHEYWYDGPVTKPYHTLIFNPNGDDASVVENRADSKTLVYRTSGDNILRDYDGSIKENTKSTANVTANSFPIPSRNGYVFRGWSTRSDGDCLAAGNCVASQPMGDEADGNGNITLYAHWKLDVAAYMLAPHVNAPVDTVTRGDTVTFTPSITKDNANNTNPTEWKFCRLIVAPGAPAPGAGSLCNNPSSTVVESTTGRVFTGSGPFAIGNEVNYAYQVPEGALYGSQICYSLWVNSSTQVAGNPAESVKCVMVAKSPRLQVWGNDVRVGSAFSGAGANRFSLIATSGGSWGEYGVIAPGTISRFGSRSTANGTQLTFANSPSLGGFTQAESVVDLGVIPSVRAYLEKAGNAEYRDRTGIWLEAAPATVNAYAANTVYTSNGTVTISGDIINPSSGANLSQMVIVASNINILPNVRQVDAWLIATDTINTCWLNTPETPRVGNCGDDTNTSALRINGPLMARSLSLNRTGGSEIDDGSAAEIINLRGDAYVWMHKLAGETGTIRTVYTRELAPRY